MTNTTITTASYETTITVKTYTYTATVVTEQGETTATLTVREDPFNARRREVKCPTCTRWHALHYNTNLQAYEPVHCTGCCIGLYDIRVVTEPVAQQAAALQVAKVAAKVDELIEVVDSELEMMSLDVELDPNKSTLTAMEYVMATPEQIAAWRAARQAIEAENATEAEPVEEPASLKPGQKAYFVVWATSQSDDKKKYALLCMRTTGMAVNCSCPSRTKKLRFQGKACKHMRDHNNMLKSPTEKQADQAA